MRLPQLTQRATRLLRSSTTASLMLALAACLGACVTDQTGSPEISIEVACKAFNPVYWSHKDTEQTIRQVVGNNAAGLKLCPRFANWVRKHGWR